MTFFSNRIASPGEPACPPQDGLRWIYDPPSAKVERRMSLTAFCGTCKGHMHIWIYSDRVSTDRNGRLLAVLSTGGGSESDWQAEGAARRLGHAVGTQTYSLNEQGFRRGPEGLHPRAPTI